MQNRIEIPISNGLKIVAERNTDPNYDRELFIGIEAANGEWIQDLAYIGNKYRYKNDGQLDWADGLFRVIVWANAEEEDYTDSFMIPLRPDIDKWDWLDPYLDTVLEDDGTDNGGTAFAGETLLDFLLGSVIRDDDIQTVDDVNEILKLNGIKPLIN